MKRLGTTSVVLPPLYAHTPDKGRPFEEGQPLKKHLEAVAKEAASFARSFGAEEAGRLLGLTHDLGKAAPAFQRYMRDSHEGRRATRSPHANPGALAARRWLQEFAVVVQAHHAGLPDPQGAEMRLQEADHEATSAAYSLAETLSLIAAPPDLFGGGKLDEEHGIRMLLSALVDADRLDTERFANSGKSERGGYPSIVWYRDRLREKMSEFTPDERTVTRVRREVGDACVRAAEGPPGFRHLTVPTGGGKTLASLLFALEHAVAQGLERVVVAIPYTSIIQQTVGVFREIFDFENVLEHHSAPTLAPLREKSEDRGAESESDVQRARIARLGAENWDARLVVTTNVQLFESLLGDHPRSVRKLHNLAKAVIVLDEVQTLPPGLLEATLDVLGWLVQRARTSVLFCSATIPDYCAIPEIPEALRNAEEVVPNSAAHFEALRRVRYEYAGILDHAEVAARLSKHDQGLVIVNSRRDSLRIFDALKDDGALYLSTFLCPAHRREVLAEIRTRLNPERRASCLVVSTQVIESGVDVDFPFVMRAMAPLDSLVQAAGRCNREGTLLEPGECLIFDLEGGASPPGDYQAMISTTRRFIPYRLDELGSPDLQREYIRLLFEINGNIVTDRVVKIGAAQTTLQRLRRDHDFPAVAKAARLIQEETTSVVVKGYTDEADEEIEGVLAEMANGKSPRLNLRKLAPYTVSLYERDARRAAAEGRIGVHEATGILLWRGVYDERVGIGGKDDYRDPHDLSC